MAEIEPFRAYRPDLGRIGPLSAVLCPPREDLSPEQSQLLRGHPASAVHLMLEGAGAVLRSWLRDDLIIQDSARSLYVVEQEVAGHLRKGFLARVRLTAEPAANDWLPLIRDTHFNVQPALALYDDNDEPIVELARSVGRRPPLEADDPRGGKCRFWAVSDQHAISAVVGILGPLPLTVVSGQAMLSAAAAYRDERIALGEAEDEAAPVRFAMMLLVGRTEPGADRAPPVGLAYYSLRGI